MVKKAIQMIGNMGWRYIAFRTGFELKKRFGLLKRKFPLNPEIKTFFSLDDWRSNAPRFFFNSKEDVSLPIAPNKVLQDSYANIKAHRFSFFSSLEHDLGANIDWMLNPDSGFSYDPNAHWLDVNDFDAQAGDIKFVWEPSRFSHLYTIIRYDKHFGKDCSAQVFAEIESWLNANAINQGPNFKCSQEISLRIMNWTFALYYYKHSPNLTEALFQRIQHYIYWQVEHVYQNINFSRIAVRNNHAITETLLLYLAGLLFPKFPGAEKWKKDGKRWFEQEIAYQVYDDGTFLQFSMNYHRVLVQLLTWALKLSDVKGEKFEPVVYDRASKSLSFLVNAMDIKSGWLPNYGNNDGALFFKLNDAHYRDYRPQLQALSCALGLNWKYGDFEDISWYGLDVKKDAPAVEVQTGFQSFDKGGYYSFRQSNALTFLRCGNHKDRPAQADNLHLDIWYNNMNVLQDAGTYKYNSSKSDLKYFMGTRSHNTVMLGNHDQMEKGSRFIWYHWTQCESVTTEDTKDYFEISGVIKAFNHIDKKIRHKRIVKIFKHIPFWEIFDEVEHKPENLPLEQLWHTSHLDMLDIRAAGQDGIQIDPTITEGYYSSFYGIKEACSEISFSTFENSLTTTIKIK